MAVYDGLCTNCGSLLRVDDSSETTTCMFCWAESDSQKAIELMQNSEGYEFPNEKYPEPDPEEKAKIMTQNGVGGVILTPQVSAPKKKVEKRGKLTPKEKVALQNKPMVKPEVSKKDKIKITVWSIVFVLVLVGIGLPVYYLRQNKEDEILTHVQDILNKSVDPSRIDIQRQDNHILVYVSEDEITEDEAQKIFENYAKVYADVYEESLAEAEGKVEVELFDSKKGGYRVSKHDNNLLVQSLAKTETQAAKESTKSDASETETVEQTSTAETSKPTEASSKK